MKKLTVQIVLIVSLFLTGNIRADIIDVALHNSPPWSDTDSSGQIIGVEIEIIKAAYAAKGHSLKFSISGYSRLLKRIAEKKFDFASPLPESVDIPGIIRTDTFLPFQDVALTWTESKIKIQSVTDLEGKSVTAYQNATVVLGEQYANAVKRSEYREVAKRETPLNLLSLRRTDVVIGEKHILTAISEKLHGPGKVTVHPIFPIINYGGGVWNEKLRQDFNAGLKIIRENGDYNRILKKFGIID